jgi:hypothetical protein
MWYKELTNKPIKLQPKEEVEIEGGKILIPESKGRLFLHWYNDKGKLVNSHQLKFATLVTNPVKLVNPETTDATVLQIDAPNT